VLNLRVASITVVALVAFAANSVLCRLALSTTPIDAATFTFVRIGAGALMLLLIVRGRLRVGVRAWFSAAMLFAYAACFSFAYLQLTTGTGALLLFGAVQVSMFAGGLIAGERPAVLEWLGWLVAFGGLIYLVLPGLAAPPLGGAALMAAAGVAWGIYSLRGRGNTDPIATTTENFVLAVPMALVLFFAGAKFADASTEGIVLALASGAVTSALGYVVWYTALRQLTSVSAAIAQLTVPVIAAAGGVVFLTEPVTLRLGVSTLLTLGGVGLALGFRSRVSAEL
jgi:drug/metabolite transporter (DMT)-like permease